MHNASSTICYSIAVQHFNRISDYQDFTGSSPPLWFIQEVFWGLIREYAFHLIAESPLPDTVPVDRNRLSLYVTSEDWSAFELELGLHTRYHVDTIRAVLGALLYRERLPRQSASEPALETLFPTHTLALVLITAQLRHIRKEHGFRYRAGDWTNVVLEDLNWVEIGRFREADVANTFVNFTGGEWRSSTARSFYERPFYRFYLPLLGRLRDIERPSLSLPVTNTDVPADILTRSVEESVNTAQSKPPPIQTSIEQSLQTPLGISAAALKSLRKENDDLRQLSDSPIIVKIFKLLCYSQANPAETIALAAVNTHGIGQALLSVLSSVLRSGEVELYGNLNETIRITLPHPDYVLDESAEGTSNLYRITQRGIRIRGIVVEPAYVAPLSDTLHHPSKSLP